MVRQVVMGWMCVWGCLGWAGAAVYYVDDSATGANNGLNWADAFTDLQVALDAAIKSDEIRVAQGTYKPTVPGGDRGISFVLPDGVKVLGGYAGAGMEEPNRRDVEAYLTVLSGDLNDDDDIVYMGGILEMPSRQDNSYHVVKATYVDPATFILLDGFTITGGNANGDHYTKTSGAGIEGGSDVLMVQNCIIEFNAAIDSGGGCSWVRTLSNCIIRDNYAGQGGGLIGAGSLNSCRIEGNVAEIGGGISDPVQGEDESYVNCIIRDNRAHFGGGLYITDQVVSCEGCLFEGNTAAGDGGAVYIMNNSTSLSELTMYRCRLVDNRSGGNGGAIYHEGNPRVELYSCLIQGNHTLGYGGGIFSKTYKGNRDMGYLGVTNCTIVDNWADQQAGGLWFYSTTTESEFLDVVNTILWGNKDQTGSGTWDAQYRLSTTGNGTGIQVPPSEPPYAPVTYCCIQGWQEIHGGQGNIGDDPLFADAVGGDYRLRSKSPCINTGDNTAVISGSMDIDEYPRIQGGTVDMGAYEYQYTIGNILYVDDSATGNTNGGTWGDAFTDLQDALAVAVTGQEIHVGQGIYKSDPNGNREASFVLKNGVTILGGYAGWGEPDPDARDVDRYRTILSGDLNGDDGPDFAHNDENSYHVLSGSFVDSTAILDGFIITAGNASHENQWERCNGAGLNLDHSSSVVQNCTFQYNYAGNNDGGGRGGAVYSMEGSPSFVHCRFVGNRAVALDGGEGYGGALCLEYGTSTVTDCRFLGNVSGHDGGAIWCGGADLMLANCLFSDNLARLGGSGSRGGAVCAWVGDLTIINCTFSKNTAQADWPEPWTDYGGAIFLGEQTNLVLLNCILWANSARHGSQIALYPYGIGAVAIRYCDVQGGNEGIGNVDDDYKGIGNVDVDPLFADPEHDDYHLKSQAGRWDPASTSWIRDAVTSPCIDAGDPASPIMYEPFPNGGRVNMGAYGGTAEASKSWFGKPVCEVIVAGDINGDCAVNLADFAIMAKHWMGVE